MSRNNSQEKDGETELQDYLGPWIWCLPVLAEQAAPPTMAGELFHSGCVLFGQMLTLQVRLQHRNGQIMPD